MEAVRKLDAVAIQFEAAGGAWIARIEARESRLGRRIAVDEGQRASPKPRTHQCAHEELQQLIALRSVATCGVRPGGVEANSCRHLRKLADRCRKGVQRQ